MAGGVRCGRTTTSRERTTGWRAPRWTKLFAVGLVFSMVATTALGPATARAASAPVAGDDVALVRAGGSTSVYVTANDFDLDGDGFLIVSVADPANGSVSFSGNTVNYTADTGFSLVRPGYATEVPTSGHVSRKFGIEIVVSFSAETALASSSQIDDACACPCS